MEQCSKAQTNFFWTKAQTNFIYPRGMLTCQFRDTTMYLQDATQNFVHFTFTTSFQPKNPENNTSLWRLLFTVAQNYECFHLHRSPSPLSLSSSSRTPTPSFLLYCFRTSSSSPAGSRLLSTCFSCSLQVHLYFYS